MRTVRLYAEMGRGEAMAAACRCVGGNLRLWFLICVLPPAVFAILGVILMEADQQFPASLLLLLAAFGVSGGGAVLADMADDPEANPPRLFSTHTLILWRNYGWRGLVCWGITLVACLVSTITIVGPLILPIVGAFYATAYQRDRSLNLFTAIPSAFRMAWETKGSIFICALLMGGLSISLTFAPPAILEIVVSFFSSFSSSHGLTFLRRFLHILGDEDYAFIAGAIGFYISLCIHMVAVQYFYGHAQESVYHKTLLERLENAEI